MVSKRPAYGGYLDEYYGLSTDTKPSFDYVVNGSTFVEIDTSKKYYYDAENKTWIERSSGGGGGSGGGSGGGVLVVHYADVDSTLDKTWQEISDAIKTGVAFIYTESENEQYSEPIVACVISGEEYQVQTYNENYYIASSASGYPVLSV